MTQTASVNGGRREMADLRKDSRSADDLCEEGNPQETEDGHEDHSFENVLVKFGTFGKFQFIQCFLSSAILLRVCFMSLGFAFIGHTPPHSCREVNQTQLLLTSQSVFLQNASSPTAASFDVTYGQCDITVSSNQTDDGMWTKITTLECPNDRHFPQGRQTTMVSEWDLVCENTGQVETVSLAFNLGIFIGGFAMPIIADRYGRKPVLCVSVILNMCLELATAFAPNMYVVLALLFIDGIMESGASCTYMTIGMEIMTARYRQLFGIVLGFYWVACSLTVGLTAYLLEDIGWRYFQAIGALTGFACLVIPFFLYESPRWLLINGKRKKALAVLKKASEQNGADFEEVKLALDRYVNTLVPTEEKRRMLAGGKGGDENDTFENVKTRLDGEMRVANKESSETSARRHTLISMLKSRDSCIILLTSWYMWTMITLVEFALYLSSSYLVGNRFINFGIMVLVGLPAYFADMYMMNRMGRLTVVRIFLLLSTVSLLTSAMLTQFVGRSSGADVVSTILFFVGKFGMACSYVVVTVFTYELFPTVLRSTGSGSCRSIAKFGSMLAPYSRPLYAVAKWAPGTIFASMSFVGLLLTTLLPETKNRNLPTTLEDMRRGKKERVIRVAEE